MVIGRAIGNIEVPVEAHPRQIIDKLRFEDRTAAVSPALRRSVFDVEN
jgi:DNA-binding NarL/FixJ family response regulator